MSDHWRAIAKGRTGFEMSAALRSTWQSSLRSSGELSEKRDAMALNREKMSTWSLRSVARIASMTVARKARHWSSVSPRVMSNSGSESSENARYAWWFSSTLLSL
eukprot:Amastigsp_a176178_6.p2 type:complete len:105 gc:universal Amastigsp_a176178_6:493-179(-)